MMIGMAIAWIAIIVGLVWLVPKGFGQREREPPTENALTADFHVLDDRASHCSPTG